MIMSKKTKIISVIFLFVLLLSEYEGILISEPENGAIKHYSLGTSTLNNPIEAFEVGSGNKLVFIFGAIHGDEINSIRTVWYFLEKVFSGELELPSSLRLLIVPVLNPDGVYYHSRLNANGVDLNRNFPVKNWRKAAFVSRHRIPRGGGDYPASEKETKVLLQVLKEKKPLLSLSYHSQAGYIYPEIKDKLSVKWAKIYSEHSGIKSKEVDWSDYYYTITGSFAQWVNRQPRLHTILVEHDNKFFISQKELEQNFKGLQGLLEALHNGDLN